MSRDNQIPSTGNSLVLIVIIIFLLLGIGSYFYFSKNIINTSNNNTLAKETTTDNGLETYSRKLSPWTFKYPKDWYVESSMSSVSVSNYFQGCKNCGDADKHRYIEFYIQSMGDSLVDVGLSAKQNVINKEKDFIESEREECAKGNCLPMTPGFTQKYLADVVGVFSDPKISAVEVHFYYYSPDFGDGPDDSNSDYLVKKEYSLIVNRLQYTVDTISPAGKDEEVVASILKSLKFN